MNATRRWWVNWLMRTVTIVLLLMSGNATVLAGSDIYTVAGTYTWVCPPNVNSVSVSVQGGGGGGGRAAANPSTGGGGGGGACAYNAALSVTPGNTYNITVGAGGLASTSTAVDGGNGGDSSFASFVGGGGGGGLGNANGSTGGTAGTAGGGAVNNNGGAGASGGGGGGSAGTTSAGLAASGGTGGTAGTGSPAGVVGATVATGLTGPNGTAPGGGAAGGSCNSGNIRNGGAGGAGQVVIVYLGDDYRSFASGNWNDYTRWERWNGSSWVAATSGQTPNANNNVYIQSGHTMTLTGNESCSDLHISTGTSTASTGLEGAIALGANTLSIYGKLRCYYANVGTTPGTSSTAGYLVYPITTTGGGKVSIAGNTRVLTATGEWGGTISTASSSGAPFEINLSSASQIASLVLSIKVASLNIVTGVLSAASGAAIVIDTGTPGQGNLTIGQGATLASARSGATIYRTTTLPAGVLTINGLLQFSGATPSFAMSSISMGESGTVEYNNSGAQTLAVVISGSGGAPLDIYKNLKLSGSSTRTLGLNTTVSGTLTMAGTTASLLLNTFSLTYGVSSVLEYAGTGAQTTTDIEFPPTSSGMSLPPNLKINNAGGVTLNSAKTITGTVTLTAGQLKSTGNLTLGNGASIVVNNTGTPGSLDAVPSFGSTVNVIYTGTAPITTTANELPASGVNNLTIDNSGGVLLGASRTVDGTLVLTSGALSIGANALTVNGAISVTSGTLAGGGSSDLSIGGSGASTTLPTVSGGLRHLTINRLNGISLGGNISVAGTLTLTSGLIDTGANTLTVASSGSISGASSLSYVKGKLARGWGSGVTGSKAFPIGKNSNYRPLSINYTALTGASTVTAEQNDPGTFPGSFASVTPFASRYWTLTESGSSARTYDITLDGTGFSPAGAAVILKYDNPTTLKYATTFSTPNYTASGLTSFSDFGLGESVGTPSITVTGGPLLFGGVTQNEVSSEQSVTLSGAYLTDGITVTPPAGFEISTNSGSGFTTAPIVVPHDGGTVASTPVYVRFAPVLVQSYSGNLSLTSTGAEAKDVAVSGQGTYSSVSDIVADGGFIYPANIAYGDHQESTLTASSLAVARFVVRDGGAGTDSDSAGTTLTSISLSIVNSANLRKVALYDDTTKLGEVAAGATVTFSGLNIVVPDGGTTNLTLRASFQNTVTDGVQVSFTVNSVTAGTGSGFVAANAGGAASSTAGNDNRIAVVATKLVFTTMPSEVTVGQDFTVSVAARDSNDNLDLGDSTSVALSRTAGSGTLSSSAGLTQPLASGVRSWTDLRIDSAGVFRIGAAGGTLTDATSGDISATEPNVAPVIFLDGIPTDLIKTNINEDSAVYLGALAITATDGNGDDISWTNQTGGGPLNGSVSVSGTGTNPVTWSNFSYTPSTNFNGTNTFVVLASDGRGGVASVTVEVAVAAVNDAPVNTVLPGFSGTRISGNVLTATNGVWNDNADTNVTYTYASFTNAAVYTYQWRRTDSTNEPITLTNLLNQTNATYLLGHDDKYKWISLAVTCTDTGMPGPGVAAVANSAWLQETSGVPTAVVFTNALGDNVWGSYSNWVPDEVPSATIAAVVGKTGVLSPATALISGGNHTAKGLYLGTNANSSGTLTMTGGTLMIPESGIVTVAGASSSTGTLNQTGGSITVMTNGTLAIASGTNSVGLVLLANNTAFTSSWSVATAPGASGTLILTNALFKNNSPSACNIGNASNAWGSVQVRGASVFDMFGNSGTRELLVGAAAYSTGELFVAESGLITNISTLKVGNAGYGRMIVDGNGEVSLNTINIALTNNEAEILVTGNSSLRPLGATVIGIGVGSDGTLTLSNNASMVCVSGGDTLRIGATNSTGRLNVTGGILTFLTRNGRVGYGVGSTGIVTITGGSLTNGTGAFSVGYGSNSVGKVFLRDGSLKQGGTTTVGEGVGAHGTVEITGGDWYQSGSLNIGTTAGATGVVMVANCRSATNITGSLTLGGGYGLVTISNATFGGGARVMVTNGGLVELTGTGSVFRCNVFTNSGGCVTNHIRGMSGGLDITNALGTALVMTNGGSMFLSFDEGPASGVSGDFWGLRWRGNHVAVLAALTNSAISIGGAAVSGVGIFTNTTETMIGYYINTAPVVTNVGKVVSITMGEDGAAPVWAPVAIGAVDAEGNSLTWTNGPLAPAHGTVSSINNVSGVTLASYTYTPNLNFNGMDSFSVRVADGLGGLDTCTVTVVVAPVNDVPVGTAPPMVSGLHQVGLAVTNDNVGTWNDTIDTNATYTTPVFTFMRQWQRADDGAGLNMADVLNETNDTFTIGAGDVGKYLRVRVVCTDNGDPLPGAATTNVSGWLAMTDVNTLPVITNGDVTLVVNLAEDCGSTNLQAVLGLEAADTDFGETATLVWTNTSSPATATVLVSGTGANPVTVNYTPTANWNGTNNFTVEVKDTKGGTDTIVVEVRVAAVNDAPVNTVLPGFSGTRISGNVLTATNGVWNDNADTNATYTYASFTNAAVYTYQWRRTDSTNEPITLTNLLNQTNTTYLLGRDDKYKWISLAVTCTDTGMPGPGVAAVANSAWLQETSVVPAAVVFTNALGDNVWGSYSNWVPDEVPSATIAAVVGKTGVLSPATALISGGNHAAKGLYLGTNANSSGTLTMTGGTLMIPESGIVTVAGASSSTGTLNQTGGSITVMTNGTLAIASGTNSVGLVLLANNTAFTSSWSVATAPGSSGTLILTNALLKNNSGSARNIGGASNAWGSVQVRGTSVLDMFGDSTRQDLVVGAAAYSTGELFVAESGLITNISVLKVGNAGYGRMVVDGNGSVFVNSTINIAVTNNVAEILLEGDSILRPLTGSTLIGAGVGSDGTLTISNRGSIVCDGGIDAIRVGAVSNATGRVNLKGGSLWLPTSRVGRIGYGIGSTGIVTITGGTLTNGSGAFSVAYNTNSVGRLDLKSGTLILGGATSIGNEPGAVGTVEVTGGNWRQAGALNVGTIAGATGRLTVVGTVQTNINGAMTVGGGAVAGDRSGAVVITNAIFGGGTRVMVMTNGSVTLQGAGSILSCNSFTNNGGSVTNHVGLLSGGIDITNALASALVITNGGHILLSFDEGPVPEIESNFWGLRWKGTNGYSVVSDYVASGAITINSSMTGWWSGKTVTVYTAMDNSYTYVGYLIKKTGSIYSIR